MAPKVKLMYFDIRARAEIIRIMLNYGGIEFEDKRVQNADWPKVKPSKISPYIVSFSSRIKDLCIFFQLQSLATCQS